MFVCLFVWSSSSDTRIFYSFGDVTISGEELQILTFARPLWPLSSEGFLSCHTFCDTGHLFIRDTLTLFLSLGSGAVTTCLNHLGLSLLGFEHPIFRLRGELCNPLRHRRGLAVFGTNNTTRFNVPRT